MPLTQSGRFDTEHGSRYLQQLCKHFAHKIEVSFDAHDGTLALMTGPVRLHADDTGLVAEVTAEDDAGLERARHVIDKHLERFAFREAFTGMDWQTA
ncbi:DUF2218 domain-containing protein [Mesobacterium pallidum]|uniref:DUF2218 domain-containing protein n=1 Tax=Mesobacterium pallidum TaxID=2872037 RepID=UPI001EE30A5F|nr:DUF2218 domain-containing protein [Mesobacterium pallidum]